MRHIRTRISRAAHDRASRPTVLACVLVLMALPVRLAADPTGTGDQTGHKQIFGWIERVLVSDERVDMKAKLDTGAKTTSLHAVNIERFKRDGKRMVRFEIVDPRDGRQIDRLFREIGPEDR